MKRKVTIAVLAVVFISATAFISYQQNEAARHPRIASAIKELQGAIEYMEKAPDDFGGFKNQAIIDSKKAVVSLQKALEYRAKVDTKENKKK